MSEPLTILELDRLQSFIEDSLARQANETMRVLDLPSIKKDKPICELISQKYISDSIAIRAILSKLKA